MYVAEWAYYHYDEWKKVAWIFPSPIGLGMLGLGPVPSAPSLSQEFKAASNLAIFAGAGLAFDKLVPLFRFCQIKRIDEVFEFRMDRRRLEETPSAHAPGEELRQAIEDLEPLPSTFASFLNTKSKLGGKMDLRWCSALVKPESAEVLTAIREHPKLKGYLEAGAPPGYLLIKGRSNPENFLWRCRELGFEVQLL